MRQPHASGFPVRLSVISWGVEVLRLWRWLWGAALGFVAVMPAAGEAVERSVLVLGRISDDPQAHYEQLKPLLD